jgi:quinol monooxygenase YgiN
MALFLLMRFPVRDYTNWRHEFDSQATWRQQNGQRSCQTFRDADDPNVVTLLCEWQSLQSVKTFLADPQLSENMQLAGVMAQPSLHIINEY